MNYIILYNNLMYSVFTILVISVIKHRQTTKLNCIHRNTESRLRINKDII